MKLLPIALAAAALLATPAFARDVYVRGHVRSEGTYVAPHVRSAPDSSRANNYGPSGSGSTYTNRFSGYGLITPPATRDHDRDGTPNYLDRDDDNDFTHDNRDATQYGRTTQPYSYQSPYRSRR